MKFRMDMRVVLFLTLFTGMCVADSTVNLARENGARVFQSSTLSYSSKLVPDAQKAVDGDFNSVMDVGSCSHTNGETNPWWRVNLVKSYRVTKVKITNRGDCCGERISGAQIRIGNSLDNNGNNNELAATVESIRYGETKTFQFKPINGKYVNIIIPGDGKILTLCEVEVFAD